MKKADKFWVRGRSEWSMNYFVTPAIATAMLEHNKINRDLDNGRVRRYKAHILADTFTFTGEAVIFDHDGNVLNGQHRLWAIVEADKGLKLHLVGGIAPEARYDMDTGKVRTPYDAIVVGGNKDTDKKTVSVALRMVDRFAGGKTDNRLAQKLFGLHQKAAEFVADRYKHHKAFKQRYAALPVLAAIGRAYYSADHSLLTEFIDLMCTGLYHQDVARHIPPHMLRELIARESVRGNSRGAAILFRKTERVIKAFLDNERPFVRIYEANEELFPIPELK